MTTSRPTRLGDRFPTDRVSFEPSGVEDVVVRLTGEFDCSTVAQLSDVLVEMLVLDRAEVIVDISGIAFMDSATVLLFERTAAFLARRSRRLVLRAPSSFSRRILQLCGVEDLVEAPVDRTGRTASGNGRATCARSSSRTGLPISA